MTAQVALIWSLSEQIAGLGEVVATHFGQHPDAGIYTSHPGLGVILSARVLAEFGRRGTVTSFVKIRSAARIADGTPGGTGRMGLTGWTRLR